MNGYIYGLRCPLSKEIRYIGQTRRKLEDRLHGHKYDRRDNYYKINWVKKLERLNLLEELKIELLEECAIEELNEKEKYWIKFYKDQGNKLVNCTNGGDTNYVVNPEVIKRVSEKLRGMFLGRKLTEETKRKISKKHKGKILSDEHKKAIKNSLNKFYENNTIKPKTIEQNKKISESLKLYFKEHPQPKKVKQEKIPYIISEETREKLRKNSLGTNNPFYGKTHTNETKNKISEKNKGNLIGEKNPSKRDDVRKKLSDCFKDKIKGKIIMLDDNDNIIKIFISVKELSEFLNLKKYSNSKFPSCLNNQIKYNGYYWKKED
jgi:flagellar motor protein MotB/predicted GIY-YIG superfamily endonuclease